MRIPRNCFDADDLALCRAHGDAVFEHYPMPAFTTEEVSRFGAAMAYRSAVDDFERGVHMPADLPLPPTYEADRLAFFAECEARKVSTLTTQLAATSSAASGAALIGAKPAKELRHMVCVADARDVAGKVLPCISNERARELLTMLFTEGADWRLCDADGWIPHEPKPDSVCPVPKGVEFETLLRCYKGRTMLGGYCGTGCCNFINWDAGTSVIAWRPVAQGRSEA